LERFYWKIRREILMVINFEIKFLNQDSESISYETMITWKFDYWNWFPLKLNNIPQKTLVLQMIYYITQQIFHFLSIKKWGFKCFSEGNFF
jgi:hypothetical protein